MQTIKDRINLFLEYKKFGQAKFAEHSGLSKGFVNNIGESISTNSLNKIKTAFPELDNNWLLTGEGEMLKSDFDKSLDASSHSKDLVSFEYLYTLKDFFDDYYSYLDYSRVRSVYLDKQLKDLSEEELGRVASDMGLPYDDLLTGVEIVSKAPRSGKLVPIYSAAAAAGSGVVELPSTREGWVNVGDLLKDSEGSLYVYGNSMIPGYPPGSLVGIRPLNESFIEPGSVYVVQTESNRYIKRLYNNDDNTGLICLSDNHIKHTDGPMEGKYLYPPFEIPISSVKIIYKVTGVIKRNSMTYM